MRFIQAAGGWQKFQTLLRTLNSIAQKHQTSIANLASRHVLENKNVAAVIIGTRLGESSHIKEHQELLDISLDSKDIELIEKEIARLDPIPGNCGDEYKTSPFLTASGDLSHHLESIPEVFKEIKVSKSRSHVYSLSLIHI